MAIEGNLAHVGLADICQLLAMGRKTGCLTISNRPNHGNVFFNQGRVTYASVHNRPDRLGVLLRGNGIITEDQLASGMEEQGRSGGRLGQVLVEQGVLSQEDLERFITIQIEEAVYYLFSWKEGTFRFEPDTAPEEGVTQTSINAEGLLLEGARRVDEWDLIEKKVPSFDYIFSVEHLPEEEDEDVELTPSQRRILPLLDGHRTVDDVASEVGLVEFDTAKALFGLIQAGFVTKTGRRERAEGAARGVGDLGPAFQRSGLLGDAAREFEAILAKDPEDAHARFGLAGVFLTLGSYEECLVQLNALPESSARRPGALRNRALALEGLGRLDEAEDVLTEAVAAAPGDPDTALAHAVVALKRGDAPGSKKRLDAARRLHGNQTPAPVFFNYAVLATALGGDLDEAARIGDEGVDLHPEESALWVNVGVIQQQRGNTDIAEAMFLKAVALSDPPPQAHKNLGDLAYERGDYPGARAHYERAVKIHPKLGDDVYLKLGQIAHRDRDPDWARMLWKRALELNPENAAVRSAIELLSGT